MKKPISVVLCTLLMLSLLAGCGGKERELYSAVDLEKFVKLGEYTGITVDTSSSEFKTVYTELQSADVQSGGFYVKKTEGTVADGDTVNIDYVGKKDGVPFDGGTDEGYDLTIGSKSFIDGFEDGLIGVAIGSVVDLNLTFPENYGNDLAGQAVVFTVTVNYVVTEAEQTPAEYFGELGFKALAEYEQDLEKRAVKQFLFNKVSKSSTVKDYPEEDTETVYNTYYNMASIQASSYGMTLEQFLSAQGMTADEFKSNMLKETVYPEMNDQLVNYAILDKEGLEVTAEDTDAQLEDFKKELEGAATAEEITEYFGRHYFEVMAVQEIVGDFLYDNAVIK